MTAAQENKLQVKASSEVVVPEVQPLRITLFAIPKAFGETTDIIQRNAIRSWQQLAPIIDVLLLGDEPGIKETADELGVQHVKGLARNSHGTPLISSAFQLAHENTSSQLLMYCNCDVILEPSFLNAVAAVVDSSLRDSFVAFGRRLDVPIDWEIEFESQAGRDRLGEVVHALAKPAPVVCKEYFVFTRDLYRAVPEFAVGRGNWDNWMIWQARNWGVPVVDLSEALTVLHQSHNYRHQQNSRQICYVTGPEAKENQRLAGGRHIISGCCGTWRLTEHGITKNLWPGLNLNFWKDLPRFIVLIRELFLNRGQNR